MPAGWPQGQHWCQLRCSPLGIWLEEWPHPSEESPSSPTFSFCLPCFKGTAHYSLIFMLKSTGLSLPFPHQTLSLDFYPSPRMQTIWVLPSKGTYLVVVGFHLSHTHSAPQNRPEQTWIPIHVTCHKNQTKVCFGNSG